MDMVRMFAPKRLEDRRGRDLLPALPRGTGLWKVAGRSYVVRHRLHVDELDLFDTDAAMRDNPPAGAR